MSLWSMNMLRNLCITENNVRNERIFQTEQVTNEYNAQTMNRNM